MLLILFKNSIINGIERLGQVNEYSNWEHAGIFCLLDFVDQAKAALVHQSPTAETHLFVYEQVISLKMVYNLLVVEEL